MEKSVLLAVDGSASSRLATDYLALLEAAVAPELTVTILHVLEAVPPAVQEAAERGGFGFRRLSDLEARIAAHGQAVLAAARQGLLDLGLAPERVRVKAQPRRLGLARDILFEAEQGGYDALLVGRRGLSRLQGLILGSVTNKVVQHADRVPVWVVGSRVESCRVLCAVDHSEASLKAVDHLAFMLGGNPACRVTIFHVTPERAYLARTHQEGGELGRLAHDLAAHDQSRMAGFMAQAQAMLREAGLAGDQVEMVQCSASSVTLAILDQARAGGHGTVVLGRRGEGRAFWLGHVCDRVLANCDEAAVWVVG
ncbi:MAG: universal stress protein [Pseudomonadota bacterium]